MVDESWISKLLHLGSFYWHGCLVGFLGDDKMGEIFEGKKCY